MTLPVSRVTLVFMHHLGGSAETWKPVEDRLADRNPCLRIDLPGFGDASNEHGRSVADMADWVEARLTGRVAGPWVLVGHSMSAKIALLIARRMEDGQLSLRSLVGLVLAAGSPPAPEPMEHDKRQEMLGWFAGDQAQSRQEADGFVRDNVASPLDDALHESAVQDVLRTSRHAWSAWLTQGSLEDLRGEIGTLSIPALVLAGADDKALGHDAQSALMVPHLSSSQLESVKGAAHLLPMEQPDRVAALIDRFVQGIRAEESDRMTGRTNMLLSARGEFDANYRAQVLDGTGLAVLRRLAEAVLPMPDGIRIDLAAKIDARLAGAVGDGWRFAELPPDASCYRQGLATLDAAARQQHAGGFAALDEPSCTAMLNQVAAGGFTAGDMATDGHTPLPGAAMRLWLQEVRGDLCQLFLAHPAVQARANILAGATGGDAALRGFALVEANQQEAWENRFWPERR